MALMVFGVSVTRAQETAVTQDVVVTFAESGEFSVGLTAVGGGDPTFGEVTVDAVWNKQTSQSFELQYTDTYTARSGGDVSIEIGSFVPTDPVPSFDGSDQADFQIPNRYVTLSGVGSVTIEDPSACAEEEQGPIEPFEGHVGSSFVDGNDLGRPLTIATVSAGCGVGMASQEIGLTLTVPAGVYPTTYQAVVTVATTVDGE